MFAFYSYAYNKPFWPILACCYHGMFRFEAGTIFIENANWTLVPVCHHRCTLNVFIHSSAHRKNLGHVCMENNRTDRIVSKHFKCTSHTVPCPNHSIWVRQRNASLNIWINDDLTYHLRLDEWKRRPIQLLDIYFSMKKRFAREASILFCGGISTTAVNDLNVQCKYIFRKLEFYLQTNMGNRCAKNKGQTSFVCAPPYHHLESNAAALQQRCFFIFLWCYCCEMELFLQVRFISRNGHKFVNCACMLFKSLCIYAPQYAIGA